MKFMKKDLKDSLTIIKRMMGKDKEKASFVMQSTKDNKILIQAKNEMENLIYIAQINSLDDDTFSLILNPYQAEELVGGKNEEMEFEIVKRKKTNKETGEVSEIAKEIALIGTDKKLDVQGEYAKDLNIQLEHSKEFNNPKDFVEILKETETLLKKNPDSSSDYVCITRDKILAAEPARIQVYGIEEDFDTKLVYLHKDAASVLSKSLKGKLEHAMLANAFVIKNENNLFLSKMEKAKEFPNLKKLQQMEKDFVFEIDAKELNKKLKDYKAKVKEVEVTFFPEKIVIDPRHEEFPVIEMEISVVEGKLAKKIVFDADPFKGFVASYGDNIRIEQCPFINIYGGEADDKETTEATENEEKTPEKKQRTAQDNEGVLWKVYTKEKYTLLAGTIEPDYDIQEKMFKEGKLKELSMNKIEKA